MKTLNYLLLSLLLAAGCAAEHKHHVLVNVTLRNDSTNALSGVKLKWDGPYIPGGVLSPGVSKTAVSAEWPNISTGELTFIDPETEHPYAIQLSFPEVNEKVMSEKFSEVEFRILSYEKAEVTCR